MQRGVTLATGETYHIYNRGAHKSYLFGVDEDYERFLLLMFLANDAASIDMRSLKSRYKGRSFVNMYTEEPVSKGLVDILAYTLMPNHFHLILRQKAEDGITTFMRRASTAYSMYFNVKYEHSGVLFQGRFKSQHIDTDAYYRWIFSYVHLNPISLCEPGWEERGVSDPHAVRAFMKTYRYGSYYDYCVGLRPERAILTDSDLPDFLLKRNDLEDLLRTFTKDRPLQSDQLTEDGPL